MIGYTAGWPRHTASWKAFDFDASASTAATEGPDAPFRELQSKPPGQAIVWLMTHPSSLGQVGTFNSTSAVTIDGMMAPITSRVTPWLEEGVEGPGATCPVLWSGRHGAGRRAGYGCSGGLWQQPLPGTDISLSLSLRQIQWQCPPPSGPAGPAPHPVRCPGSPPECSGKKIEQRTSKGTTVQRRGEGGDEMALYVWAYRLDGMGAEDKLLEVLHLPAQCVRLGGLLAELLLERLLQVLLQGDKARMASRVPMASRGNYAGRAYGNIVIYHCVQRCLI